MVELHRAVQAPRGQPQPGQGGDDRDVRFGDRPDIAHDPGGATAPDAFGQALAEPGNAVRVDGGAEDQDFRVVRLHVC